VPTDPFNVLADTDDLAVFELYSPITPRPTRLRLRLRSITSENRFSTLRARN
jgi:hypothetical protein